MEQVTIFHLHDHARTIVLTELQCLLTSPFSQVTWESRKVNTVFQVTLNPCLPTQYLAHSRYMTVLAKLIFY